MKKLLLYFVILIMILIFMGILFLLLFSKSTPSINSFAYLMLIFSIYFSIPITLSSLGFNYFNEKFKINNFKKLFIGLVVGVIFYVYHYYIVVDNIENFQFKGNGLRLLMFSIIGITIMFANDRIIGKD